MGHNTRARIFFFEHSVALVTVKHSWLVDVTTVRSVYVVGFLNNVSAMAALAVMTDTELTRVNK
jgi:hypothetical protein